MQKPSAFWINWLRAVSLSVVVFGLILVLVPDWTQLGFSALAFGDSQRLASFDPAAVSYIRLTHAVLGSVMVGWGAAIFLVIQGPFAAAQPIGWRIIAISVLAWFLPDTTYSLWSGFWQNAVLNLFFLVLFAIPLMATRRLNQ
jgi:hypothetical protein